MSFFSRLNRVFKQKNISYGIISLTGAGFVYYIFSDPSKKWTLASIDMDSHVHSHSQQPQPHIVKSMSSYRMEAKCQTSLVKDMKLLSVHIFFRHGARMPLRIMEGVDEVRNYYTC